MLPTLIILGVMTSTLQLATAALPDGIIPCSRSDPRLKDCISDNLNALAVTWTNGSRAFGLPPSDPQPINNFTLSYRGGLLGFDFLVPEDMRYFLSEGRVVDLRHAELTDSTFFVEVSMVRRRLYERGSYKLNFTIWRQQFISSGAFRINMTNVAATWKVYGKLERISGQDYMKIEHFLIEVLPETMLIHMTDLLPDERFNWLFMQLLNRVWDLYVFAWLPPITEAFDGRLTELANKVFLKVPYEELFPK